MPLTYEYKAEALRPQRIRFLNSNEIIFTHLGNTYVADIDTGEMKEYLKGKLVEISPSRKRILLYNGKIPGKIIIKPTKHTYSVVDLDSNKTLQFEIRHRISSASFSPDEGMIAFSARTSELKWGSTMRVFLYDLAGEKLFRTSIRYGDILWLDSKQFNMLES
jgi:hypothetical protein